MESEVSRSSLQLILQDFATEIIMMEMQTVKHLQTHKTNCHSENRKNIDDLIKGVKQSIRFLQDYI